MNQVPIDWTPALVTVCVAALVFVVLRVVETYARHIVTLRTDRLLRHMEDDSGATRESPGG